MPEAHGNSAYRSTRGDPTRDLFALLKPQRYRSSPALSWGNPSVESQDPIDAALVPPLERPGNIGYTLTALPALPEIRLLPRREPCPCRPLHTHPSSSGKIRRCCVDRLNPPPKADIQSERISVGCAASITGPGKCRLEKIRRETPRECQLHPGERAIGVGIGA